MFVVLFYLTRSRTKTPINENKTFYLTRSGNGTKIRKNENLFVLLIVP